MLTSAVWASGAQSAPESVPAGDAEGCEAAVSVVAVHADEADPDRTDVSEADADLS
jgi:hypothetical protein